MKFIEVLVEKQPAKARQLWLQLVTIGIIQCEVRELDKNKVDRVLLIMRDRSYSSTI